MLKPLSTSSMQQPLTITSRRRATVRKISVFVAVLALALPVATVSAARHIGLASSNPAKDAHVMAPLSEIRLTFTGKIDVAKASMELVAADSSKVAVDALREVADSNRVAVAQIKGALRNGTYMVQWKAVAADGAGGSGSFGFMYMGAKK